MWNCIYKSGIGLRIVGKFTKIRNIENKSSHIATSYKNFKKNNEHQSHCPLKEVEKDVEKEGYVTRTQFWLNLFSKNGTLLKGSFFLNGWLLFRSMSCLIHNLIEKRDLYHKQWV